MRVVAAHTDSPCLKLKPVSAITKHGYLCVGVQPYGGGLWYTWFDRDLSVAGRVIHYTNGDEGEAEGESASSGGVSEGSAEEAGSPGEGEEGVGSSTGAVEGRRSESGSERESGAAERSAKEKGPVLKHSLVKIEEPILRIPTLAIHLDRCAFQLSNGTVLWC